VLNARPGSRRRAITLVELLVAITLGAVVLGTAASSVLRQQRAARRIAGMVVGAAQSGAASSLLLAELADLMPSADDLVAGEARDTALQLRAPVASGVACDSAVGRTRLALSDGDDLALGAVSSPPRAGDSLWWYSDESTSWRARRITDAQSITAPCPLPMNRPRHVMRLELADADVDTIPPGALLRVTRPLRYVLYRSGDGSWQLGLREWSDVTQRFAPPQPIAGPFARRLVSGERTGFRYFDAEGWELPAGPSGAEVGRIARIRITAVALVRAALAGGDSLHVDSADVALQRQPGP
jgi:type II secretory pathway pseudopilin PulG